MIVHELAILKETGIKRKKHALSIGSFHGDTRFPGNAFLSSDIISKLVIVVLSLYKIAGLIVENYSRWTWQNTCTDPQSRVEQRTLTSWLTHGKIRRKNHREQNYHNKVSFCVSKSLLLIESIICDIASKQWKISFVQHSWIKSNRNQVVDLTQCLKCKCYILLLKEGRSQMLHPNPRGLGSATLHWFFFIYSSCVYSFSNISPKKCTQFKEKEYCIQKKSFCRAFILFCT